MPTRFIVSPIRHPHPQDPPSPLTLSKSLEKLQAVVNACSPRVILMSADVNRLRLASKLNLLSSARRLWPDLPYKTISSSSVSHTSKGGAAGRNGSEAGVSSSWFRLGGGGEEAEKKCFDEEFLGEEDVAFLQFTSGSTSEPKGVMVTFANLMHNATYISGKAKEVGEWGFEAGARLCGEGGMDRGRGGRGGRDESRPTAPRRVPFRVTVATYRRV